MPLRKFSLRRLLVSVIVVAAICGVLVSIRKLYHHVYFVQVRTVRAALAHFPEIENVWVSTNSDLELEIEELYFSTEIEQGVILKIDRIDGATQDAIEEKLLRALRQHPSVDLPNYAEPWRWGSWK